MGLRNKSGFSMIELLVAMVVIALGLLSISALFPLGSRARMRGEGITKAIELAQQRMEQLVELGYDNLEDGCDSTVIRAYKVKWCISTLNWGPGTYDALKIVTDTVTYITPGGGYRKVGLTTYVSPKISGGGR